MTGPSPRASRPTGAAAPAEPAAGERPTSYQEIPDEAAPPRHPGRVRRRHRTAAPHPRPPRQDQSRPYPDRGGELVRVYLTVDLEPASNDQPGHRGGDPGSGPPRR